MPTLSNASAAVVMKPLVKSPGRESIIRWMTRLLTAGAQHDHVRVGERSILPDLFADLIATHPRHHDVQEDDTGPKLSNACEALLAVTRRLDVVSLAGEQVAQRAQDVWLVVDYED